MSAITPCLLFNGDCEAALDFYKRCFGGEIIFCQRYGNAPIETPPEFSDKIIHAELEFFGGKIMASDSYDQEKLEGIGKVSIGVQFDSEEKIRQCFADLQDGGKVVMPLEKQFWNALFGIITDRFGVNWMLNHFYSCEQPSN